MFKVNFLLIALKFFNLTWEDYSQVPFSLGNVIILYFILFYMCTCSKVSSFRTLRVGISPFCTNTLTALRTLSIDVNLTSLNKVTSVRTSSINMFLS